MCLRWPYLEAVNLNFIFIWDGRETEDRAKVFTSPLSEGLLINNNELRDILVRTRCMAMQIKPKKLQQNWKSIIRMFRGYLINHFYLQRINLKRPLSRGSRFKIYFRLECWENRGSRQNFHEVLLFKDRILINPNHYVTFFITNSYFLY